MHSPPLPGCPSTTCGLVTCADSPVLAQMKGVLRPSAEPARLPPAAKQLPAYMRLKALMEGVTLLSNFLGYNWRPRQLPPEAHYVSGFPSHCIGTLRSALYEEQVMSVQVSSKQRCWITHTMCLVDAFCTDSGDGRAQCGLAAAGSSEYFTRP